MVLRRTVMAMLLPLAILPSLLAAEKTATQPTDNPILWQQTYTLREHPQARRLMPLPGGGYRIVGETSWTKDPQAPINDRFGFEFFVLDVDRRGGQVALKTFDKVTGRREQIRDAAATDGGLMLAGSPSWLARLDARGRIEREARLLSGDRSHVHPCCIIARGSGRFLIGGSLSFKDAWVGEVDETGELRWEQSFDHGADESVYGLVGRADGGFVFVASSGNFDKFGRGPSALWLVSCDAGGKVEHEASLPDGRLMPGGQPLLIRTGAGCALAFSRTSLPGTPDPARKQFGFSRHIACFDQDLKPRWEKEYAPTLSMWSLLVARADGGLISIGGAADGLSIVEIDPHGEAIRETLVPLAGILSWPVDLIPDGDTLTILAKGLLNAEPSEARPRDIVRLVRIGLEQGRASH